MKHAIEWTGVWSPAVMAWEDEDGTLAWEREPAELTPFTRELMDALVAGVAAAREQGPVVLETPPAPYRYELEDAAHAPADFLRLVDHSVGGVRTRSVRLPPSLQGAEMTPAIEFSLPAGAIA